MKKIAIVRGSNLNKFEMQSYEPLVDSFDITAFTSTKHRYEIDNLAFPVTQLLSPAEQLRRLQGLHRFIRRRVGNEDYLMNLGRHLKGFDLVHTAEIYTGYTQQAIRAKERGWVKKVVATIWENVPFLELQDFTRKPQDNWRKIDHFCAVSQRSKEMLMLYGIDEDCITVVTPGVDTDRFRPQSKEKLRGQLSLPTSSRIILSVGRMVWEKGFESVIIAFKKLAESNPRENLHLVLIGTGPEENKIKQLLRELKIEETSTFSPHRPYSEMPLYHAAANFFIIPSASTPIWQEQVGMVYLEAMASGSVVIGGLSGSVSEIIGEAGVLVQPVDWYDIYQKVQDLLNNPSKVNTLQQRGRRWVEQKYSTRVASEKLRLLYKEVL